MAHIYQALALVFIVPFLPHSNYENKHLFEEDLDKHSPLSQFEHEWKVFIAFVLAKVLKIKKIN